MAAKQTAVLMGRLVEHQDYFDPLSTEDAQWAIQNPKKAAALCVAAIRNRANGSSNPFFDLMAVTKSPATTQPFIAMDNFKKDTRRGAKVKIWSFDTNFEDWFLGKIEQPIGETTLCCQRPAVNLKERDIVNKLGGPSGSETTLTEIFALISMQPRGEEGVLLTNSYLNIFFVKDKNGTLRIVFVRWSGGGGWSFESYALRVDDDGYSDNNRVFSRNS